MRPKKAQKYEYGQYTEALSLTEPSLMNTLYTYTPARTHIIVRQMPQGGQIQTSALFGILMANLSVGKSEALPGV